MQSHRNLSESIVRRAGYGLKKHEGFSISTQTGETPPNRGYTVSHSAYGEDYPKAEHKPAKLRNFMAKNPEPLSRNQHFFGGWEESNRYYLDVSQHHEQFLPAYHQMQGTLTGAKPEKAMWDVKKGANVVNLFHPEHPVARAKAAMDTYSANPNRITRPR